MSLGTARLMSLNKMINAEFPPATVEQWKQKAEDTLKGKPIDTLSKSSYENIKLKPLYTQKDLENKKISQFPGNQDFRRGISTLGYVTNDWKVAQTFLSENPDEMKEWLTHSFQKGQSAISFKVSEKLLSEIQNIIADFFKTYSFSVDAKDFQAELLKQLCKLAEEKGGSQEVSGYIGMDPIACTIHSGPSFHKLKKVYDQWAETIHKAAKDFPHLKTILVDTTPFHNGGANAVQELSIALASGVEHINMLTERSLSLETVLEKAVFKFAAGPNFFMEVAKFRAARMLWSKLTEAYGASDDLQKMVISAETSKFTKTKHDPYVNLLRAGNEAFAAILGGIQYLHVSPYNEPEGDATAFSDRIARNTQLILKEEAHLKKTVDPAGGSWYIETLTNELAEKAWELFLEIDSKGGLISALSSGWIQEQIARVKVKRHNDIFTRKQSIIGTNIYANPGEQPLHISEAKAAIEGSREAAGSIPQERLSVPFEILRGRSEKLKEQKKIEPAVGLMCLGSLMLHKPRVDFIAGFVTPGGISTIRSDEIKSFETAKAFIENKTLRHYFICGSNDQYHEISLDLIKKIKGQFPSINLYLAGAPENQSEWLDAGINEVITVKSNCYEMISKLLDEMEAESK